MEENTFKTIVEGDNQNALFTLKIYRGEGMALLAMNWKNGTPTDDFVGFAIEYKIPNGEKYYVLKNRLSFEGADGKVNPNILSTRLSPIQKFRWVHFPSNPNIPGQYTYKVTPVFMNEKEELSYGEHQEASVSLSNITYADKLNVTFTRGFISSQAFVDNYQSKGDISLLLPSDAKSGLEFVPTHPSTKEALKWMGFEAREAILDLLDKAVADPTATVCVTAFDLNLPEMVNRLKKLGSRLRIIIDNSADHKGEEEAETKAATILEQTAGVANVKRQHLGGLQHNKVIVVNGQNIKTAICGSTNFSWRGWYVQANNAVILHGAAAIQPFLNCFEDYWKNKNNSAGTFGISDSSKWMNLNLSGIDAQVTFSPHLEDQNILKTIADDISQNTSSSLLYSLAFLYQTPGAMLEAIKAVTLKDEIFVYGISDKRVGGLNLQKPSGKLEPVYPTELAKQLPEPFKTEPKGGSGIRMHHKFVVIDFDKPTARVYFGSFNFSKAANIYNGENLLLIKDQRVAISYMIEALRIFDHYHFRIAQQDAKKKKEKLALSKRPKNTLEVSWWREHYTDPVKIQDRNLFA